MSTLRTIICKLGVAVLSLLLSMNALAATLVRQSGAVGIVTYDLLPMPTASAGILARQYGAVGVVTYDPLPDSTSPEAYTRTTAVPVPYAWLLENWPNTVNEYISYETSAKSMAANGRKVWECYVLGLNPEDSNATNDFKITSFPLKADGTPDIEHIVFNPPQARWNVPATYKVKGAANLDDVDWPEVTEGNKANFRFFKVELVLP